jgi:SfnB family sulfur acquisition oxidoreductase
MSGVVSADGLEPAHIIRNDAEALEIARAFANELASGASERDREKIAPRSTFARLAQTGLLGIIVPRECGGAGVSNETLAKVFAILAAGDSSIAQVPQNHFVFLDILIRLGSVAQKRFFFDEVMRGARFGNALSERDTKHVMDFKTRLSRHADGDLRLSGTKYYCTGALTAQYVPVFALDEEARLVVAYLDRNWPGIEITDDWNAMGQRATLSGTTRLTEVRVPPDRIVPLWTSFGKPQTSGAFGQVMHAAIDIGIARAALEEGSEFVATQSRPWFESGVDSPADEPLVAHRFGELAVKVWAAEELLAKAGRALDTAERDLNEDTAAAASLAVAAAKAFGGDVAVEVSTEIFALAGTRAADDRVNLHRHWRNARTHTLHDPNRWKYLHIGNFILRGVKPPNHGLI